MRKNLLLILFTCFAANALAQTDSLSTDSVKPVKKMQSAVAAVRKASAVQKEVSNPVMFGYLSYDEALRSMPDYSMAQKSLDDLKAQYDAEAKRVEDEFNAKYEQFLEGQRDFPESILQKRQTELQELLNKNIKFKEESQRLLDAAESDLFAPLHGKLATVLNQIGIERGYVFIINTDANACPFINVLNGVDISEDVKTVLQK